MESLDILILGVEASIALAGFAGIIATFQFGGEKETRRGDAVGLTMILQMSLLAAMLCSLAILLNSFSIKESTLWVICSVVVACMHIFYTLVLLKRTRGVDKTKNFRELTLILFAPSLFLMLINLMNASDFLFHREAGPVVASIVYALSLAGFMFSRLLLRPIWRNVRTQEAARLAAATSG
jgi:uncharacterized membrane protein